MRQPQHQSGALAADSTERGAEAAKAGGSASGTRSSAYAYRVQLEPLVQELRDRKSTRLNSSHRT